MILTVTMNPSVDINYKLNELKIDKVNRVSSYSKTAGGKGLNVARVLVKLEERPSATGLLGGSLGNFISSQLVKIGVKDQFLLINKESRNCIAVIHEEGKQTEILEAGPYIEGKEAKNFKNHFKTLLDEVEVVTLSGSLPNGLPEDYYTELIKISNQRGIKVILDCSGNSLRAVLKSPNKPFAIKPNSEELRSIIEDSEYLEEGKDYILNALQKELFSEIECILVSNGSKGAFVKWHDIYYSVTIPEVEAVNPVGSGDATVAGLAKAIKKNLPPEDSIKEAMTAGILNAMNEETGMIDVSNYSSIFEKIVVQRIQN